MDRDEAFRLLGVADDVELVTLKQRFRELARDHHPDHGGDPILFGELRRAFALLSDELGEVPARPPRPLVSRGRPSRVVTGPSGVASDRRAELDDDAQDLTYLLEEHRACRYLSRAPGARTNRFASSLSAASTSSLRVDLAPGATPDRAVASVELIARTRSARRAVTGLDVARVGGAAWVRHRGDAVSALRATLRAPDGDDPPLGRRTAAAIVELLDALAWPLREWSLDRIGD